MTESVPEQIHAVAAHRAAAVAAFGAALDRVLLDGVQPATAAPGAALGLGVSS